MKNILTRVFAVEFYKSNITLFLLILGFAFGFMRGAEHTALAGYFIRSGYLLSIPVFVWASYTLLVIWSNGTMARAPQNNFLLPLEILPPILQWSAAIRVAFIQLIPAWGYASLLVAVAMQAEIYIVPVEILVVLCILTAAVAARLRHAILHPQAEVTVPLLWNRMRRTITRNYLWFNVEGAIRRQFLTIAGYKITGLMLLFAGARLCEVQTYDIRLPALFVIFAYALNIAFTLEYHLFENREFALSRLMPFTFLRRYRDQVFIFILFTLPECVLLLRNMAPLFSPAAAVTLCVFGLSINLVFYNFLYTRDRMPGQVMSYVYFFIIVLFLSTLSGVPLRLMIVLNLIAAYAMLRSCYYSFEYKAAREARDVHH